MMVFVSPPDFGLGRAGWLRPAIEFGFFLFTLAVAFLAAALMNKSLERYFMTRTSPVCLALFHNADRIERRAPNLDRIEKEGREGSTGLECESGNWLMGAHPPSVNWPELGTRRRLLARESAEAALSSGLHEDSVFGLTVWPAP